MVIMVILMILDDTDNAGVAGDAMITGILQ